MLNNYEIEILEHLMLETREPLINILKLAKEGASGASKNSESKSFRFCSNERLVNSIDKAIKKL